MLRLSINSVRLRNSFLSSFSDEFKNIHSWCFSPLEGLKIRSVRILWNQRFVDELLAYNSIFQNVLEVTAVAIAERLQHIYRDSTKCTSLCWNNKVANWATFVNHALYKYNKILLLLVLRFSIELEDPIVVFPDLTKHSVSEVQQMTQVIMISKLQRFIAQNDFVRVRIVGQFIWL
jgi:hypothetical protein